MAETEERELINLIEKITTSGRSSLEEEEWEKLKSFCMVSKENVKEAFNLIWHQLKKNHSEIRLSSVQIIDFLFNKSSLFRDLLLEQIQEFVKLTMGLEAEEPLPPPEKAAKQLKIFSLTCFKRWHSTYSSAYLKLRVAKDYLNKCKNIHFQNIESNFTSEREKRLALYQKRRLEKTYKDFEEIKKEIIDTQKQLKSCLQLLVPSPFQYDDFQPRVSRSERSDDEKNGKEKKSTDFKKANELESDEDENNFENEEGVGGYCEKNTFDASERKHGVVPPGGLQLNIPLYSRIRIKRDEENKDVIASYYENLNLLKQKHFPKVKEILKTYAKYSAGGNEVREALHLKNSIQKSLKKTEKVEVLFGEEDGDGDEEEEEEEENFVEVPFKKEKNKFEVKNIFPEMKFNEQKSDVKKCVEVGDEKVWNCRAPLHNGKLCPRKDKIRCPFHGKIIPRDEMGRKVGEEKEENNNKKNKIKNDGWRDDELELDISLAIGVDLTKGALRKRKGGGKKGRSKIHNSGITDIKKKKNDSRQKLEKLIFSSKRKKKNFNF